MIGLANIAPPAKLATTLRGLKMHFIDDMDVCDATEDVKLGGFHSQQLGGPAPRALVTRLQAQFEAQFPGQNFVPFGNINLPLILPVATRETPASLNPQNWVE
jgi:hypothetical protein